MEILRGIHYAESIRDLPRLVDGDLTINHIAESVRHFPSLSLTEILRGIHSTLAILVDEDLTINHITESISALSSLVDGDLTIINSTLASLGVYIYMGV